VDDVLVAVAHRGGRQRREIRSGAGLAEALAPPLGTVDHAGQEALPQFLAAVVTQADDQVAQTRSCRRTGFGDLLVDDHVVHRGQVPAAVLGGPRRPEEPRGVQRLMPGALGLPVGIAGGGELALLLAEPGAQVGPELGFLG
jgi:hypothetical protein